MSQLYTLHLLVANYCEYCQSEESYDRLSTCWVSAWQERDVATDEVEPTDLLSGALWRSLNSICLALSRLLINTNCITSGAEPRQWAQSAPAHRWIGVGILAMLLFFHIREKHMVTESIPRVMYFNSKLTMIILSVIWSQSQFEVWIMSSCMSRKQKEESTEAKILQKRLWEFVCLFVLLLSFKSTAHGNTV